MMFKKKVLTLILALFPLLVLLLTASAEQFLEARQIVSSPTGSSGIRVEKQLTTKRQKQHTPKSPCIRGVPVLTPRMFGDLGVCCRCR